MKKQGCKIGRIKFKSGGELRLLPMKEKSHCFGALEELGKRINDDTLAVGFFVIGKDRLVSSGCSYEVGFTPSDFFGACEVLKTEVYQDIWEKEINERE